ncbi:tRNA uridine-5-carboxymethylaminomethyl(34) synthesis GTPase MnmE [[Mycoplasma] gypis]|uniref:tRNA modification GTPase MnmE n=1 Tax=[Mycoplasma] gypis TaxID=92404 RepID=A0ABZ2RNP3_9BACT|nr:tRNA uridine-5-carboxymethylaminomethyl(34) synthesis GTPase MnmE [[Mycoplasma] gypis]MBN0919503.1 tRNA uridine-5-carboxymethylaminomethyl(34) synthesis GTPase MnmE [[Mycoplasma] gypis]
MWDTIAAISSGKINQAVSLIRICGPEAIEIIKKIFKGKEGKNKEITFGYIVDDEKVIDEVLVSWFPGKENYVGEDTVEINAHGGVVVTNMILQLILSKGARLAYPGEFTRRAFLNGKINLIKAEAINDLIHAKTEKQATLSIQKFDSRLSTKMNDFLKDLGLLIGHCEVNIDYPEMTDIEELNNITIIPKVKNLLKQMKSILTTSKDAQKIFEGIKIAIVGQPNAGKSSLLNALLNENKAIVTDIEGTTRDIVEGSFQIDGVLFKLIDTAGIRETENKIEKIGIDKAKEVINQSDIVLHILDTTKIANKEDDLIKNLSESKNYIQVFNKVDVSGFNNPNEIKISAKDKNIDELISALKNVYKEIDLNSPDLIYNARQLALVKKAHSNLKDCLEALKNGFGPEVVIVDLTEAWMSIGDILGKNSKEDLLDTIFCNFCLGK